jgi:hypothetical protein
MDVLRQMLSVPPREWRTKQVISFDWHDGPRSGLGHFLVPDFVCYFETLAEQWSDGSFGDRIYRLRRISDTAMSDVLTLYGLTEVPRSPLWAPHGPLSEAQEEELERTLDRLLENSTPLSLLVRSRDLLVITELWLSMQS